MQKQTIFQALDREDKVLEHYFERWKTLGDVQMKKRLPNEGWTLMQAAAHLVQAETAALLYIRKKSMAEDLPDAGLSSAFRLWLVEVVLALPIKMKAPAVVAVPPEYERVEQLIEDWKQTRRQIRQFVEVLDDHKLHKTFFRHPYAGLLSLRQMAQFFINHLSHHQRQFDRLEAKLLSTTK